MSKQTQNELLVNAEIALSNGQYEIALEWLRKAVEETPDDLYTLSRAGAVCVAQQLFDEALQYFQNALDIDPTNGDNHFNLGNAYFFHEQHRKAFDLYVEAERIGCSTDVEMQLYYQMMLLSMARQDFVSAKIYIQKCEDADPTGSIALSPDFISEKLKLAMLTQDYEDSGKYAAQMVAIAPSVYRNYAVYYSILMAEKDYSTAEKVLFDAKTYAVLSNSDKISLASQESVLYLGLAEAEPERVSEYHQMAVDALMPYVQCDDLTDEEHQMLMLTLCDVYYKIERYDDAIALAKELLACEVDAEILSEEEAGHIEHSDYSGCELSDEELSAHLEHDLAVVDNLLETGEVDSAVIDFSEVVYDADGAKVHLLPDALLNHYGAYPVEEAQAEDTQALEENAAVDTTLPNEVRDKLWFVKVSSYLAKEDYQSAHRVAKLLKQSENTYYAYFGLYAQTLSGKYITKDAAAVERSYEAAIAYFRSKIFADHKDTLAAIFRARLYAECGKYENAKQIANMLSSDDRESVLKYIEQQRNQ